MRLAGRGVGAPKSGASTVLGTGVTIFESGVTYGNFLTRFSMFEVVSLLVAPMRDVVQWERELPEPHLAAVPSRRHG